MDPISITGTLIAVLQISGTVISTLYEYRNEVKSASTDAARIITELNTLRSVLENLLQAVGEENSNTSSGSPGSAKRLANFQTLTHPDGVLMRCLTDLEAVSVKLGGGNAGSLSGWKKGWHALVWPFKKKDVDDLLQSVDRAKGTMNFVLSADSIVIAEEIHAGMESIKDGIAANSLDQRRLGIRDWLAAPDPFPNHAAARKKRQPLTGNWFLGGKMYESWRSSPRSFLWLYGIPGAGKSILCSSIIEDLLSNQKDSSLAVAFYYFDFNDVGKRDTTSLVRALVAQLLAKIPTTLNFVEEISSQIDSKQPDFDFVLKLLRMFVGKLDQVYLVIDALDECEECEELMSLIEAIHGWELDRLHILVASRQLPEIEEALLGRTTSSICLQNSTNEDIHMLIQERLSSDRKFQKWPHQVRSEIYKALTSEASGMFRWVVCQLDMLRNCITLSALRKALKSLPKTLDETYERILTSIDESYISDVKKILQFLAFSPRQMNLLELVEVLAVDIDRDEPQFNPENRIPEPKDILSMCSTLVTTTNLTEWLRLAHFSVKEYLLSDRIKSSKASAYSIDPISGNLFIAQTYLAYLLGSQFSDGHCGFGEIESRRRKWPLFRAAVLLFPTHISTADPQIDAKTASLVQKLFSTRNNPNGGNYAAWVGGLIPTADKTTIIKTPPLYYAASFDMIFIVKMLLSDMPKAEIDVKGGRALSTPLHVACFRGREKIVQLLLEAGADPNSTNCKGESCIYWALNWSVRGYKEIYGLLIKYGAHDDVRSFQGIGMLGMSVRMENVHVEAEPSGTQVPTDMIEPDHNEK